MSQWTTLLQRIGGKWQLPLAAASAVALPASMTLLRPNPNKISMEDAATAMEQFVDSGLHSDATRLGEFMLSREDCEGLSCATIELNLARALFGKATSGRSSTQRAKKIVAHYKHAAMRNATLTPDDLEHFARALEWQGQYLTALQWYDEAISKGHPRVLELKQHAIILMRDKLETSPQQLAIIVDDFLASVDEDRLDLRLWGIREKLHLLDEQGRPELGERMLLEHAAVFADSDMSPLFEFLRLLVLFKTNRFDEAEVGLRTLRNAVETHDEVNAMTGWLLGRTVMYDGGPQRPAEALSFFRDVERLHPGSPYAAASKLGSAEALAFLERHDEAIAAYRTAVENIESVNTRLVNVDLLRVSLGVTSERRRAAGDLESALAYGRLAATLIDERNAEQTVVVLQQVANIQAALAQEWEAEHANKLSAGFGDMEEPGRRAPDFKRLYGEAADTYAKLAEIDLLHERRSAESSWLAAELAGKAGRRSDAVRRYRKFVVERPQSELVPRGLLRIGKLLQAAGRLDEAVKAYQRCYRRFPHTLDGIRTLIPLAQSYLAQGPDNLELAERTLQLVITDSQVFTPEAPEFTDALFLLGDVYGRQGRYEKSISTLEEALDRYPNDPRIWRSRFLLANAYRRSASALRDDVSDSDFAARMEHVRVESRARLKTARELYRELITEYESRGSGRLTKLERVYLRHAHLYEADSYFDMQDYRSALSLYDNAAGRFKDSPTALSAYVQVINCHVFLGQPREARAALARARVLASRLGPEVYEASLSPETKEDWKTYFDWLAESNLF